MWEILFHLRRQGAPQEVHPWKEKNKNRSQQYCSSYQNRSKSILVTQMLKIIWISLKDYLNALHSQRLATFFGFGALTIEAIGSLDS